jgi:hypothetical protein
VLLVQESGVLWAMSTVEVQTFKLPSGLEQGNLDENSKACEVFATLIDDLI